MNMDFDTPLTDTEVVKVTNSAWQYEASGNNWVGRKARASTDRDEILSMSHDPHAAMLLMLLRVSHPPIVEAPFAIDQVKTAELLGWSRGTLQARISALLQSNHLKRVHYGRGKGDPHLQQPRRRNAALSVPLHGAGLLAAECGQTRPS
jgi:hypothetical protein